MSKEYDIVYELGPRNWLDVIAGEAVLLGQSLPDPELTMKGTMLSKRIRSIPFDSEDFFRVEALALELVKLVETKKCETQSTCFLDEICVYRGKEKSLIDWEYNLIFSCGRYQINMTLPEYIGPEAPDMGMKEIEKTVRGGYRNPSFYELKKVSKSEMMECQKMDTTDYYTDDNKLVCHIVDFNHECMTKRGLIAFYYVDDFKQVMEAWEKVKTISGRKQSG